MIYAFSEYELDTDRHELRHDGVPCALEPQVFAVLLYLIQHRDRVVRKQELLDHVWPDTFVSESALYQRLRAVRQAVGDSGHAQQVVKTVPKQGYRFSASVDVCEPSLEVDDTALTEASTSPAVVTISQDALSVSAPSPSLVQTVSAERKLVTVLCGTLSNAELLADQLGFEYLAHLRQSLLKLVEEEVKIYGGVVQSYGEDGFLALFGLSVAHEDHPRCAILSGLAIRDKLHDSLATLDKPRGLSLDVRLGVHTGVVRVSGSRDEQQPTLPVMGETTELAIRLQSMVVDDRLVVSESTMQLLRGEVDSEPFESVPIAGQRQEIMTHLLHGVGRWHPLLRRDGVRRLSRFVGRERELSILERSLSQTVSGQGQVVGIMAEAGMGKSRLLHEFARQLSGYPVTYVEGHCASYGSATPYLPLLDVLRQLCGIMESDPQEMIADRVHQYLRALDLEVDAVAPYLLHVLGVPSDASVLSGLSPQAIKTRTFAALQELVLQSSQQQAMILAVENLHWIDPTTEEWLAMLVEELAHAKLSLVSTYRPGYRPLWMDKSYAAQMSLPRLDADDSMRVVQSVLQTKTLQAAVVDEIVSKADGNPFFLEEMAHAAIEGSGNDQTAEIPDTVQAVLAARMGHLTSGTRRLLQMAAVIGREVPFDLLQGVSGLSDVELNRHLRQLQVAELLHGLGRQSKRMYRFKHALTQDVAYQSLLPRDRRQIHQQVALALSDTSTQSADTPPELLAYHYTEAECYEQAVPHWHIAAQSAIQHSAYREAQAHCMKGLKALTALPETQSRLQQELALQTSLASALHPLGQASPVIASVYERAWELCHQIEDAAQVIYVLRGLSTFYNVGGHYGRAYEIGQRILALAQRLDDPICLLDAYNSLAISTLWRGDVVEASQHFNNGIALHRTRLRTIQPVGQYPKEGVSVQCFIHSAVALWLLGYVDQSWERVRQGLKLAHATSHPLTLTSALFWAARVAQYRREVQTALERAEAALTLCAEHEFIQYTAGATIVREWALTVQDYQSVHIAQMRQQMIDSEAIGSRSSKAYYRLLLADALAIGGQVEDALIVLADALEHMQTTNEHMFKAEIYRLKGELLLRAKCGMPDAELAPEACFQQALDLARQQQAKSWELRAATSLARLWQSQGKRQQAYDLLAPVYGWFTEGFDTSDLKDAKALLDELG